MHFLCFSSPWKKLEKNCLRWPQMGPGGFFPTNPDFADILDRTALNLEKSDFLFVGPQLSGFPGPQISTFLDLQAPDLQISRFPNSQISRFPDFQTPPAPAASGNLGTWKSGNLEIWKFGDLGPVNPEMWRSGDLEIQKVGVQQIKNQISLNSKPFCPKCRQSLDW